MACILGSKSVLVVDDAPLLLETTAALLEDHGYLVTMAGSGAEALALLQDVRPDVIVCDLHMPEMDGFAVIAAVRARDPRLPVIILSSEDDVYTVLHAIRGGAFDYVMKGNVDDGRIVPSIDRAIGHHWILRENDRLASELRRSHHIAVAASEAKSRFLASMSHEFRTPLNAIIGYTGLLLEEGLPEATNEDLLHIQGAGLHLLALVDDVLDLSKIEAGRMEFVPEVTSADEAIHMVHAMALPLVERNTNRLVLEIAAPIGNVFLDPHRLKQILFNLVSNAAKFTSNGLITVSARRASVAARTDLVVAVQDTGIGLTPEQCSRLFKEFEQAEPGTTSRFGGTGLGLAISQNLAHLMGGHISVESEYGRGSRFTLWLPVDARSSPAP